jgi:hypothetical protein
MLLFAVLQKGLAQMTQQKTLKEVLKLAKEKIGDPGVAYSNPRSNGGIIFKCSKWTEANFEQAASIFVEYGFKAWLVRKEWFSSGRNGTVGCGLRLYVDPQV